ncbi:putative NAD(P)H-dependent FMN-containing oxidoreductase YwqN [Clostridium homopropionicum DSM 5847]|uniref:Putative NAD(P)H-dependent FMN-containing oxidoreductase YwqN n=1 Tax=Clostridium homopropionicum DSM 5847 TaxID=1121318 RepID=A0A0L6Z8N6_9CLOT|nr:flavodoxin family protein [Clostridium homopropionicum]KOA19324.1 putative NAD(P)H-dependent FMN-containing oxidoreductase YwqN [Clostridium homopropionicum DSM 5847]SFG21169.1 NADPH-dependent FMN reductase [Clostridium homopropionicum]
MKIVVLTGSSHKAGTSSLLAERFIEGAKESGHEVYRFDAAFKNIHPCIACDKCKCGENLCVFQDSMAELSPRLIEADLIAFVTPLYYYGPSAQIKAPIDRFYGIDNMLRGAGKKAVLLVTGTNNREWAMKGIVGNYTEALQYLQWQDCGQVLAKGCCTREDIEKTDYPQQAYLLGKGL